MIDMTCDHCNGRIPDNVNGGVRLKLGTTEHVFHLCEAHQSKFLAETIEFLQPDRIRKTKGSA